jgi:hypothetical protein
MHALLAFNCIALGIAAMRVVGIIDEEQGAYILKLISDLTQEF